MWALYGHSKGRYGIPSEDTMVARFTTEKDALSYIQLSELKNPTRDRRYRAGSLLQGYDDAWVDWDDEIEVPIDPTF